MPPFRAPRSRTGTGDTRRIPRPANRIIADLSNAHLPAHGGDEALRVEP